MMASEADKALDMRLRRMAANRGCRLVKSRRRNPVKPDYGRYGLVDAQTGQAVFGFARTRVRASAEEIEDFLKARLRLRWRESLREANRAKRKKEPDR